MPPALTAIAGLTVGHWTDPAGATGCTVVLGPPEGMRGAVAVRGRATGTRELDALDPRHLVGRADALLRLLLTRAREGDARDLVGPWRACEEGVRAHLTAEEEEIFPEYARSHPNEVQTLRREHAEIR